VSAPFAAVALATALAVALGACRAERPGWTFAPPAATPTATASVPESPSPAASPPPTAPSPSPTPGPSVEPTPIPAPSTAPVARTLEVPILYYHRVAAPPPGFAGWSRARRERFLRYDVIPAAFGAQLDWLLARGYTTILPRDLAAHWDAGTPLPPRPVIISFDDGTHDWVQTVLPLLRERAMVAQFYITIQAVPRGGMSWRELRALRDAGMGIGAHGLHHRQLAGLPGRRGAVTEPVMRREVTRPRSILERRIGVVPDSFSYVGGGVDATLRRLVEEAGYTTARSILRGTRQDVRRRFMLRVVRIGARTDVRDVRTGILVPGLPAFTRLVQPPAD
jgi:peptidoglycan/xylan/chitin deacetylase (PgdA/CDA1 family)